MVTLSRITLIFQHNELIALCIVSWNSASLMFIQDCLKWYEESKLKPTPGQTPWNRKHGKSLVNRAQAIVDFHSGDHLMNITAEVSFG